MRKLLREAGAYLWHVTVGAAIGVLVVLAVMGFCNLAGIPF